MLYDDVKLIGCFQIVSCLVTTQNMNKSYEGAWINPYLNLYWPHIYRTKPAMFKEQSKQSKYLFPFEIKNAKTIISF